jgi:hypothetical protein
MYNFSSKVGEKSNVDINLRQELDSLNHEFGISVLYIRNCKFVRCSCFDDIEKTGNPDCKRCYGSGYFASIQKFRTIQNAVSSNSSNIDIKPIGAVDTKEEIFYFDYKVVPKERDFILKVTWKGNRAIDVVRVFEVTGVYEMRGDNGRVEVFGVHVDNRPDAVKDFNNVIKRFPDRAMNILGKGGRYIWPTKMLTYRNETNL